MQKQKVLGVQGANVSKKKSTGTQGTGAGKVDAKAAAQAKALEEATAPKEQKLATIEQLQVISPNVTCLTHAYYVDQAILTEESRLVVVRFGSHDDLDCQRQDHALNKLAPKTASWAVFYKVDNRPRSKQRTLAAVPWGVPDFNQMYELYDRTTVMFFYRNKHMMCDFGTGNNNKMNWVLEAEDELEAILEAVYQGARKGRGLVTIAKDYSTRHAY